MRGHQRALVVCVSVAAIAALTAVASSSGATRSRPPVQMLYGVSAISATDAWAVGEERFPFPSSLILHWNGQKWFRVPSPGGTEGTAPILSAVSAVSSTDVWALGSDGSGRSGVDGRALILHWDGSAWHQVPGPAGLSVSFSGISADSAADAWAIGAAGGRPLVIHWNGTAWKTVALPRRTEGLAGIAALSPTSVWAAGYAGHPLHPSGLLLHWNGNTWARVFRGRPKSYPFLGGVGQRSSGKVWAGGVARPDSNLLGILSCRAAGCRSARHAKLHGPAAGFSASSPRRAWAIAGFGWALEPGAVNVEGPGSILRWNGRIWRRSRIPVTSTTFTGISALAGGQAWAVGFRPRLRGEAPVILHWNGSSWRRQTPTGL
jgi:hypothetical protein